MVYDMWYTLCGMRSVLRQFPGAERAGFYNKKLGDHIMRKTKKFLALLTAGIVMIGGAVSVNAYSEPHVPGCSATARRYICESAVTQKLPQNYHVLYTTVNGEVRCQKTLFIRKHTERCANSACNAVIYTNVTIPCEVDHQYCPNETGLCQR